MMVVDIGKMLFFFLFANVFPSVLGFPTTNLAVMHAVCVHKKAETHHTVQVPERILYIYVYQIVPLGIRSVALGVYGGINK